MKKACLTIFFVFYLLLSSYALPTVVDSLQQALESAQNDSVRINILHDLSFEALGNDLFLAKTYGEEYLELSKKIKSPKDIRQALNILGQCYYYLGNYKRTLQYFREVVKSFEDEKNDRGIARMYNNIGIVYEDLKNYDKALEYYFRSLEIERRLNLEIDKPGLANNYHNIGEAYRKLGKLDDSYSFFMQAIEIDKTYKNNDGLVKSYSSVGTLFMEKQKLDSALYFLNLSLSLVSTHNHFTKANLLNTISKVYVLKNTPTKALRLYEEAILLGHKVSAKKPLQDSYEGIASAYASIGDYKNAYSFYKKYSVLRDSIYNEENLKQIQEIEKNYQIQKKEKEIELLKKDAQISSLSLSRNQMISYYLYSGLFLLFITILFLYQQYKVKNQSNRILKEHNKEIAKRNENITSSITYAKDIQQAILPHDETLKNCFSDSFLINEARDIVNGDFYWIYSTQDYCLVAVVDCTGHGVPGAFMTVLANALLNQIIVENKIHSPAEVLKELKHKLNHSTSQQWHDDRRIDGLDLVLCKISHRERKLTIASAKRPAYLVSNAQLSVIKGNKSSLQLPLSESINSFIEQTISYQKHDYLYLFTDGVTDQFGEFTNKKFMHSRLKELLLNVYYLPSDLQKQKIIETLKQWQGKLEQTDDILMLGIRLT